MPKNEMVLKFESNEVKVSAHEDGAISFSSDGAEHFIYLYPHQVKLLKVFLSDLEDGQ